MEEFYNEDEEKILGKVHEAISLARDFVRCNSQWKALLF